jgi:hypothetical protein
MEAIVDYTPCLIRYILANPPITVCLGTSSFNETQRVGVTLTMRIFGILLGNILACPSHCRPMYTNCKCDTTDIFIKRLTVHHVESFNPLGR